MEIRLKDWDSLEVGEIQSKRISKHMFIVVVIVIIFLFFFIGIIVFSMGLAGFILLFCYPILASIINAINKSNTNYAKSRCSKERKERFFFNYESDEDEQKLDLNVD